MTTHERWESEPDYLTGNICGLDCAIIRNTEMGNLCGYVAVPKNHPLFGVKYSANHPLLEAISVHGGLTFSENYLPTNEGEPVVTEDQWWFGFDCAHADDITPLLNEHFKRILGKPMPGTYKDIDYVKKEVEFLAVQLAEHLKENALTHQEANK